MCIKTHMFFRMYTSMFECTLPKDSKVWSGDLAAVITRSSNCIEIPWLAQFILNIEDNSGEHPGIEVNDGWPKIYLLNQTRHSWS